MSGEMPQGGTPPPGPILGIDPGSRRIGLAVSDPDCRVAVGLPTFTTGAGRKLVDHLREILQAYGVRRIVVGEPRTLRGEVGAAAQKAASLARHLRRELGIDVEMWDERLTTAAGRHVLRGTKAPKSARDRVAATLILQSYLDRRNAEAS